MKRFVFVLASLVSTTLMAQGPDDARTAALNAARPVAATLAASLGADHALVPTGVLVDSISQGHVRYQQTFRGIPVFEGEAIVHVDLTSRSVLDTTNALLAFGAIDTRAAIGANAARGRALEHLALPPGLSARSDLVLLVENAAASLAWQVRVADIDAASGPVDQIAFVEAQGRGVLRSWDNLHTGAAAGTGQGFFNGTVGLTTDQTSATSYRLRDPNRGNQLTCDMKNRQANCYYMDDADNLWGTGTLSNRQTVAVDAQYGTAKTWDYFSSVHGRNGIANDGKGAINRAHFGRKYNNAYWSDSCFCMTYGDGDGVTFNPFDSLDVAGHEMSHGVTSRTSNLTYSGESGGLNEGTSDIFGSMVEYFANNTAETPDYQIGERLYVSGNRALRYMYRPSLDGRSADCWYSGVGSLNVHYSSGVANHLYYLLAEGTQPAGGPSSPTCQAGDKLTATGSGSLTGIGRAKAERIWYRALTVYMTASTNYHGARAATLSAASDLYGSSEVAAVAAAWSAVNVN